MSTNKVILVTGVGGCAGHFLIDHLKKNGFRVVAIDANIHSCGLLHGDVNIVVPNCLDENYVSAIRNICLQEKVSFILPLIDEELLLLKALESEKLKVVCPDTRFIELSLDKFILMNELVKIDVNIPKTFLLSEDYSQLKLPCIIKPRKGRGSKDVYIVNNISQLKKILASKEEELSSFLIQEKIEGSEYTVSVVVNPNNQLVTVVPKKIIEKKGITKAAITERQIDIEKLSKEIVKKLKPCNSFNVQLIISKFDGKPYVFEINPRYSTTVTLTIAAGVDEIMSPLHYYLGTNIKTSEVFIEGLVLIRSVKEDYLNIQEYNEKNSKIFTGNI